MQSTGWIVLALVLAGLYVLVMQVYRLNLAAKRLSAKATTLKGLLAALQNVTEAQITPATPSTGSEYPQLISKRAALKRNRLLASEARERRLIQRIATIDVDKRKK